MEENTTPEEPIELPLLNESPDPEPITNNPHKFGEDPEDHIGAEISDPWVDDAQTDWPNETDEETN